MPGEESAGAQGQDALFAPLSTEGPRKVGP